jgi:hypothetical protein
MEERRICDTCKKYQPRTSEKADMEEFGISIVQAHGYCPKRQMLLGGKCQACKEWAEKGKK